MPSHTLNVRKIALQVEEIRHDGGPLPAKPLMQGAVSLILENPFAGRYEPDVLWMMDALKPYGLEMSQRLVAALGGADKIEAYGKGAVVGIEGEFEHGALWHVPGGYAMRELIKAPDGTMSKAIVPSTEKVGVAGTAIDIPLHHINAAYVRSHFNSMEVRVQDSPRPRELMFVLAMATGGRIHARMGGLAASEISKWDGQR
jgi:hypothetical protein